MMTLAEMQKEIIENRKRRGWPSATEIHRTALGIMEEAGEFARGLKRERRDEQIDALGDLIVFCLGGLEILGVDVHTLLDKIVTGNKTRSHDGHH